MSVKLYTILDRRKLSSPINIVLTVSKQRRTHVKQRDTNARSYRSRCNCSQVKSSRTRSDGWEQMRHRTTQNAQSTCTCGDDESDSGHVGSTSARGYPADTEGLRLSRSPASHSLPVKPVPVDCYMGSPLLYKQTSASSHPSPPPPPQPPFFLLICLY